MTRVAFGVPVLNGARYLEQAVGSLLAQSYRDFGLVVMDNASTDATPEIGRRFAEQDPRVRYRRNPETVGMVDNWRRAFDAAVEEFGEFEYFAFGSDHDVWHPEWLASLISELDADERLVLAYPVTVPIDPEGKPFESKMTRRRWDTAKLADPVTRVHLSASGMLRPGNVTHGLFRTRALDRCGVVQATLGADRLLIAQLAVLGTFKQVPRELWMRRFWKVPSPPQRSRMFTGRIPAYSYLPVAVVHGALLFRWVVLAGRGRPAAGRLRGLAVVVAYLTGRTRNRSRSRTRHFLHHMDKRLRALPKRRRKLRKSVRKSFKARVKQLRRVLRGPRRLARRLLHRILDRLRGLREPPPPDPR